ESSSFMSPATVKKQKKNLKKELKHSKQHCRIRWHLTSRKKMKRSSRQMMKQKKRKKKTNSHCKKVSVRLITGTLTFFYNASNSFSEITWIPFFSSNAVVTPTPWILLPLRSEERRVG